MKQLARNILEDPDFDPSKEYWRTCVGYPGFEVSSFGNVRRSKQEVYATADDTDEKVLIAVYPPKEIKPFRNGPDQPRYSLNVGYGPAKKQVEVHRIVADAFIGYPDDGQRYSVKHIDGNEINNHIENLEYVSYSTILSNARNDKILSGELPLKVNTGIHCITTDQYFSSLKAVAAYFKIPYGKLRGYIHKVDVDYEIPKKWDYDYDFEKVGKDDIKEAVQNGKYVSVDLEETKRINTKATN